MASTCTQERRRFNKERAAFITIANNMMNERIYILSQQKNMGPTTAYRAKSIFVRLAGFLTERFDAIAKFVTKCTF